ISYNYSTAGTHVVSLSISNGHSCTHSVVKQVEVISMPVADFTWETACAGEKISFHEQATGFDPNSNYQWDFNSDGTIDATTDGDAEHIYLSGGAYNVTLTVANPAQCTNSISKSIEIIERPIVDMDVIAQCYGQESQMNDLSLNVSPGALYSWDFNNDGTTDDTTVGSTSHIYTSYDSYVVNLTVDNGNNCSASAEYLVNFADAASPDFTINKACKGEEVVFTDLSTDLATGAIYSWDFNGDSFEDSAFPGSTAFTFNNAGQYDATLTIDNGGQCMAYKTLTLDITPPPSVDLGPDQLLCVEGTVTLDAGAGYSAYLWPDGSTEQTYTIDQVGDYMVRVEDAKSCINTDTISIQLLGDPVPSFEYSVELSLDGMGINFINTSIYADTYSWDFGDGNTSSEFEPNYVFSDFYFYKTSVFHVCLYASNLCGHDAQYCEDIYISPTQFMEEGEELISVYPNPASQYIFLELKEFSGFKKMGLFDAHGKIYWQERTPMNRYEVDLNELSKGIYYFILEQNDKYFFKRFVKN
ncbi:MAG: PKD domain-containing protein, partial [Bacteroidota bacterium]